MAKVNIKVVDKVDEAEKKLASFEWDFLRFSLGPKDMETLTELEVETYEETECIDERAAAQTILTGRIRVENNCPGGGFDYFNKDDLKEILKRNNGLVVLDPHRSCGWGGIRMKFYEEHTNEITEPLPSTTMIVPEGKKFANGVEYIKHLVEKAFKDNNFLNSVMRSAKLQRVYNFRKDFDEALKKAFPGGDKLIKEVGEHKELIELAFVFGKLTELKTLFEKEAESIGIDFAHIRLNPDLLFDQPSHHIASGAVLNLTERKLIRRFSLEAVYQEAFFADLDFERFDTVLEVILGILEGDHSATKGHEHDIFIVVNESQLSEMQKKMNELKKRDSEFVTNKNIFIHVIENDEKVKSKEELLSLVR